MTTQPVGAQTRPLARCGAVLVAHARLDLARGCVASLRRWLDPEQIVVVLNRHDPPGPREAVGAGRVISPPSPQGYGANLNFGVRALPGDIEFVVLANDDVVFEGDSLPRLVDALRRDPRTAIAGPRLVNADGSEAASFGSFPTATAALREVAILPRPLWALAQRRPRAAASPDFVVGAAMLVRRESFDGVGGFDEDFFLNHEETDLCFRLHRAGWTVSWCPDAVVTHLQGSSISRTLNYETFYASLRLYHQKRLGPLRWPVFELLLAAVFAAGALYSAAGAALRPASRARRLDEVRHRWRTRIFLRRAPAGR